MIGYVTIGTNDLERAKKFYGALAEELGAKPTFGSERMQGYGSKGGAMLAVCTPYDGGPASAGNGAMVALASPSREVVDQVHAAALAAGGACEGTPGERMPNFYGAYFRDLDGNKFCVFKMG